MSSVFSDYLVGVAQEKGKNGTGKHEDYERDVGSVVDGDVLSHVDILSKWDLNAC